MSVQTADMEATLSTTGKLDADKPGDALAEAKIKHEAQIQEPEAHTFVEAEEKVKLEVHSYWNLCLKAGRNPCRCRTR